MKQMEKKPCKVLLFIKSERKFVRRHFSLWFVVIQLISLLDLIHTSRTLISVHRKRSRRNLVGFTTYMKVEYDFF